MNEQLKSPSEKMAEFRQHMLIEESGLSQYLATLPFSPDPYQEEALEKLALGDSVLVAAPTGAGKTVVGEGAAYLARQRGQRVFYTTPIKALSNQKLRDFRDRFGESEVGLLTGDTAINPDAPIVVMTTEVLRNMIYAGKDLSDLGVVVMDEVHYLSDRFRGPVWEEVLIQLPEHVRIVALSATLSNAGEFGRWVESVRGSCAVVTSDQRPVPLYQHMMVAQRLYDLYARPRQAAKGHGGSRRINPDLLSAIDRSRDRPVRGRGGAVRSGRSRRPTRPAPVSRFQVVERLRSAKLLPAIIFVFSRAGCDEAAGDTASFRLGLTTAAEREQIGKEVEATLALIPAEDHAALDLHQWAFTLEEGVAAHHAGLLPQQKEAVERLFTAGLIKVVFATETLALGINMPARTVVLESLEKWDGSEHVRLSPREYTQLTGRAGRRGIDVEGNAVVIERGVVSPEEMVELSSGRSYPLRSAFHPNYNMAVNLLARLSASRSREILESSFAQFQTDATVVKEAQKLRRLNSQVETARAALQCSRGDAAEYFELREQISTLQKEAARVGRDAKRVQSLSMLNGLRTGDVVRARRGRRLRRAVVVQPPSAGSATPLARVVSEDGKIATLGPREAEEGFVVLGRMPVPGTGARRSKDRAALAGALRNDDFVRRESRPTVDRGGRADALLEQAGELESQLRAHPVHSCPDREQHAGQGHEYARLLRERNTVARKIDDRSARIVEEFDRVCAVLRRLDFLAGGKVTSRGQRLRGIFGERDLLVAEAITSGAWQGLRPEELAAIVSTVVYEPRGEDALKGAPDHFPTAGLEEAWNQTWASYQRVHAAEVGEHAEATTPPAGDLVEAVYRWAKGSSLAAILERSELSGGDFVRLIRQILDMLDQIRRTDDPELRDCAVRARQRLLHGVVAWTEIS